jgi:hypothetical protein
LQTSAVNLAVLLFQLEPELQRLLQSCSSILQPVCVRPGVRDGFFSRQQDVRPLAFFVATPRSLLLFLFPGELKLWSSFLSPSDS